MTGTIHIREAAAKDASQITILSLQLGNTITVKDIIANMAAIERSMNDVMYVAVLEERVLGWIHVFHAMRLETGTFCEIGGLVVSEGVRGRGIGKQLVEKAKKWSAERGFNRLRVRCNVKRTNALAFYLKIGFEEKKQQKVFEYGL